MSERPYSIYTRANTWAALYSQCINACYAIVPNSTTNNSIYVLRCESPQEAAKRMRTLTEPENLALCADYLRGTISSVPALLKGIAHAVVLARSSDYYHYHLDKSKEDFRLVICGLHDSYLLFLPAWEMCTNKRYKPRETSVAITSADFDRLRRTHYGHRILVGALMCGDADALTFINREDFNPRTRRRIKQEVRQMQQERYRGRPLTFLSQEERQVIAQKISAGLHRYYGSR